MTRKIPDILNRSCETCEKDDLCRNSFGGHKTDYEGLPEHAWNCWRPKGTILVWQEKEDDWRA